MSAAQDANWLLVAVPDHGRCGSVLDVMLIALGIERANNVSFGEGIASDFGPDAMPGRLKLTVTVAPTASPGWREIACTVGGRTWRWPNAFEVLSPGSAGGGSQGRGIGSHLI